MSIRCSVCPCVPRRNPIYPSGPLPCRVLFLGEAPSTAEDRQGIPFADRGQSGQELNDQYLPLARLFRDQVAVANPMLCSNQAYKNPSPEQAQICASTHLPQYLERLQPQIIVTMGAVSASLFPGTDLMLHHGIPRPAKYAGWEGIHMAMFHPAYGLRSTAAMIPLRRDFQALGRLIKDLDQGTVAYPQDPYPSPDYQIINSVAELNDYLPSREHYWDLAEDTENLPDGTPYCLTFSHTPGTARLIYATNEKVLRAYHGYLQCRRPLMAFHNWLHDVEVRTKMGLVYPPPGRFVDTMIRAYDLGLGGGGDDNEEAGSNAARGSLGLKSLAFRHLHMEMKSFKDTCLPFVIPQVISWLMDAEDLLSPAEPKNKDWCKCGHPQHEHQERGKSGKRTGGCLLCGEKWCEKYTKVIATKQDKSLGLTYRKVKLLNSKLLEGKWEDQGDGTPTDPWKTFEEWHGYEKDLLEGFLGPLPVLSIGSAPELALLPYACSDADATIRLKKWLDGYKVR
jgi:uracil-DNA glycosylase family 4